MSRMPQRSKNFSLFSRDSVSPPSSGRKTQIVSKIKIKQREKGECRWVFKHFEKSALAQIEAGIAALYVLIKSDLIPKVRAVYDDDQKSVGSVSKLFSDFQDLQSYLADDITDKKINFLIKNGLSEIFALSYFFEEDDLHKENVGIANGRVVRIDFDMSAYSIVSDPRFRGARGHNYVTKSPQDAFQITARDLNDFPNLTDADPYYWPTKSRTLSAAHGYSNQDALKFRELSKDDIFVDRSYLTFLKIIVTPDETIENMLAAHISDPDCRAIFSRHFIERKKQLKTELQKSAKFKLFWKGASDFSIRKIIADFFEFNCALKENHHNLSVNVSIVTQHYYEFCRDMMHEPMTDGLKYLVNMTELCRGGITQLGVGHRSMRLYTPLVALRDVLLASYRSFYESKELSAQDIELFFNETSNALKGFEFLSLSVTSDEATQLKLFFDMMRNTLRQLIMYCSFWNDSFSSMMGSEIETRFCSSIGSAAFVNVPVLKPDALVHDMSLWLQKMRDHNGISELENKATLLTLLEPLVAEMEKAAATYAAQAVALAALSAQAASTMLSYASSWFSKEPAPAQPVSKPEKMLDEIKFTIKKIERSVTTDELCRAISQLLSIAGNGAESFRMQFVSALVNQYSAEFSVKHIIEQLQKNPQFAQYLEIQINKKISDEELGRIVPLFIQAIQPGSTVSEDGFVEVEHSSSHFFLGSK